MPVFRVSDYIRTERQHIAEMRTVSSTIGDTELLWTILDGIAAKECVVSVIETELDDALVAWR